MNPLIKSVFLLTAIFLGAVGSFTYATDSKPPRNSCTINLSPDFKVKSRREGPRWEEGVQKIADLLPPDFSEMEELLALSLIDNDEEAISAMVDIGYELTERPRLPYLLILNVNKVHGRRLIRFYKSFKGRLHVGKQMLIAQDPRLEAILNGTEPNPF